MSHIQSSSASSSHFQLIIRALRNYEERTKRDLLAHPLAAQVRACKSPSAILLVLQQQVDRSRCSHERLTKCLDPTVNVLYTFSMALEEGVRLDISPAKLILAGVGVLLLAARDVHASYDIIADIFEYILYSFRRLELYSEVSPTDEMKNTIAEMLVEVLSILAIATEEISQSRMKKWLKKLIGRTYIEHPLRRLDKLTREESRMSTSQVLKAIITSMDEHFCASDSDAETVYDGKDAKVVMQRKANDVDQAKRSSSPKLISPDDSIYAWGKDDSTAYIAPPAYGTPDMVLLPEHGGDGGDQ